MRILTVKIERCIECPMLNIEIKKGEKGKTWSGWCKINACTHTVLSGKEIYYKTPEWCQLENQKAEANIDGHKVFICEIMKTKGQ